MLATKRFRRSTGIISHSFSSGWENYINIATADIRTHDFNALVPGRLNQCFPLLAYANDARKKARQKATTLKQCGVYWYSHALKLNDETSNRTPTASSMLRGLRDTDFPNGIRCNMQFVLKYGCNSYDQENMANKRFYGRCDKVHVLQWRCYISDKHLTVNWFATSVFDSLRW